MREQRRTLDDTVARALQSLAQRENVPLKTILLTAFCRTVATETGKSHALVGLVQHTRPDIEGADQSLGLYLNCAPFGLPMTHDTLSAQIQATFAQEKAVFAHRNVPLKALLDVFQSDTAPFDAVFNYTEFRAYQPLLRIDGIEVESFEERAFLNFPLQVQFVNDPRSGSVELVLQSDSSLLDRKQIDRFAARLTLCLTHMCQHIAAAGEIQTAWDAALLLPEEVEAFTRLRDQAAVAYDAPMTLVELVEQAARGNAQRVAVEDETQSLTYDSLMKRSHALAERLQALGVEPQDRVAVLLDRSVAVSVVLMGILKAGAAYVPLDPAYPEDRLKMILDDAEPTVLITTAALGEGLETSERPLLVVEDLTADLPERSACDGTRALPFPDPHRPAYLIYTSGTTGRPKGVVNGHLAISNRLLWMRDACGTGPDDAILQKTSCGFDVSVWEFFLPLISGAKLYYARPGGHRDPAYLREVIEAQNISVIHFVPTMLTQFLADLPKGTCPSLTHLICSGEALPTEVANRALALMDCKVVNLYGPTEAAVDVTSWVCQPDSVMTYTPIGRAIANIKIHVLNEQLQPVPFGTKGELCISGVGLADGYWKREALTAEKFPTIRAEDGRAMRIYRTGDIAEMTADGIVRYHGRADTQVKIRGQRIELEEIESVVRDFPGVQDCAAMVHTMASGSQQLVMFYASTGSVSAEDLAAHVAQRLPEAMCPAHWCQLDELPTLPNGKLDRRNLPEITLSERSDARYDPPQTETERVVAEIWADVLGLPQVSRDDNFFSIGGDSILSLTVLSRLKARGWSMNLEDLYAHPTLASVATRLHPAHVEASAEIAAPAESDRFPVSRLQLGLIYQTRLHPATALYHDIMSYKLSGPFDAASLRAAWAAMVAHHPILRTRFLTETDAEPLQEVLAPGAAPQSLKIVDWTERDEATRNRDYADFIETEKARVFDWDIPPIHLFAHRLGDDEFVITLSFHDSLMDGWSVSVLISQLYDLYHAQVAGQDLRLPPTFSMAGYVAKERETEKDPVARTYWLSQIADTPPSLVARHWSTTEPAPAQIIQFPVTVNQELSNRLLALARSMGVSLKSVLLAAHMRVLTVLLGRRDVVGGLEHNARPEREHAEAALGLFLNTLPFRCRIEEQTWTELVHEVHERETSLLPHRAYPLARMLRDAEVRQAFDTVFNFVNFHVVRDALTQNSDTHAQMAQFSSVLETEYPLRAEFGQDPVTGAIRFDLHYNAAVLSKQAAQRISRYYQTALNDMVLRPDALAASCHLAAEDRLAHQSGGIGYHSAPVDTNRTLPEILDDQAQHIPDRCAVEDGRLTWSYADLAGKVTTAATHLMRQGVRPGTAVYLLADRSAEYLAAILAIMRLGAFYVPLDPRQPAGRMASMITQCGAGAILFGTDYHEAARDVVETIGKESAGQDNTLISLEQTMSLAEEATRLPQMPTARDRAYVIFTSGSTGLPKGAAVRHDGMLNHIMAKIDDLSLNASTRLLQNAPQSFDISVWQFLTCVVTGGTCVIASDAEARDPTLLLALVKARRVTDMEVVPAVLQALLSVTPHTSAGFSELRCVISTGEALKAATARGWLAAHPGVPLVNAYGPTECSDDVTHHLIRSESDLVGADVPIGKAIMNTELYLLDPYGHPAPPEVPAELVVGGICVGEGYVGDPERTAKAFVEHDPDGRGLRWLYKTGDLVRRIKDGALIYVERIDQQVKIGGNRIELGEIENHLAEHPAVLDVAVVAVSLAENRQALAAAVVPKADAPTASDLQGWLSDRLPPYMIPRRFGFADRLPATLNGKIDRRAVAEFLMRGDTPQEIVNAPQTDTQSKLHALWCGILQKEQIDINDGFFDIGGDSLHLIQLQAQIRAVFSREISLVDLLAAPTIQQQARLMETDNQSDNAARQSGQAQADRRRAARNNRRSRAKESTE